MFVRSGGVCEEWWCLCVVVVFVRSGDDCEEWRCL